LILLTVDVLGLKVDVFVVDVLKVDVLEVVQMGRPGSNDNCSKIQNRLKTFILDLAKLIPLTQISYRLLDHKTVNKQLK
jgi:hypothetical protein